MKRWLRVAHRYIGITFAALWMLQAVTGALLVFHWELDDWAVAGPAAPLDAAALSVALGSYASRYPGHTVSALYASGGESGRFDVILDLPDGRNDILRVDGRGTVLRERPGNYDWLHIGPFQIATYLHQTLFAGTAGQWFLGASGVVLLLNLAFGLRLAWPRSGGWRRALWPPAAQTTPARLWGLHRALGLWLVIPAMLVVACGICLAFRAPIGKLIGVAEHEPPIALAEAIPQRISPVTAAEAIGQAMSRYPAGSLEAVILPTARTPWYEVQVLQRGEARRVEDLTTVHVSSHDGRVLAEYDERRAPLANRMFDSLYALHTGGAGGIAMRWLAVMTGIWLTGMVGLGSMLWSARRAARKRGSAATRPGIAT